MRKHISAEDLSEELGETVEQAQRNSIKVVERVRRNSVTTLREIRKNSVRVLPPIRSQQLEKHSINSATNDSGFSGKCGKED